jgi:acyl carrier protein
VTAAAQLETLQELRARPRPAGDGPVQRAALGYLTALIREGLELEESEPLPEDAPLGDLGVDSLLALEIGDRIAEDTGVHFSTETLADQPTLRELVDRLATELAAAAA